MAKTKKVNTKKIKKATKSTATMPMMGKGGFGAMMGSK